MASLSLILNRLSKKYGKNVHTQLRHDDETQLFVAVLLSPQCTDKQVNITTRRLFNRFHTFADYADADMRTLCANLKGINYYKTKARHLKSSAEMIRTRFHGKVPRSLKSLMELPGVGRKVANVILNEAFGINEGIAVDTHVAVVSRRLHLSRHKDPYKIEQDLIRLAGRKEIGKASNLLIELGRDTCRARNKECQRCVLKSICPSSDAKPQGAHSI